MFQICQKLKRGLFISAPMNLVTGEDRCRTFRKTHLQLAVVDRYVFADAELIADRLPVSQRETRNIEFNLRRLGVVVDYDHRRAASRQPPVRVLLLGYVKIYE